MEKATKTVIQNINTKKEYPIIIKYDSSKNYIKLYSDDFGYYLWRGVDIADAFKKLRLFFEKKGFLIFVNGARKNVWASGMLRDMTNGLGVYVLKKNQLDTKKEGVNILEYFSENIVTYQEQRAYYKEWLNKNKPPVFYD